MKPVNKVVLNGVSANATSQLIPAQFLLAGSLQVVSTGLSGTAKIQFSNDEVSSSTPPQNWNDLATVSITGAGSFAINKTDLCYEWLQVVYANTGGSGAVTGTFKGYGF